MIEGVKTEGGTHPAHVRLGKGVGRGLMGSINPYARRLCPSWCRRAKGVDGQGRGAECVWGERGAVTVQSFKMKECTATADTIQHPPHTHTHQVVDIMSQ